MFSLVEIKKSHLYDDPLMAKKKPAFKLASLGGGRGDLASVALIGIVR